MPPADEPGFGVYIHWPFCAQKCPYCDFNSHVRHGGWDEARFLAAYKRELDYVRSLSGPQTVSSIFFGGGTPSLMKAETAAAILDHIAASWTIAPDAEVTLEANPGSVEAGRFKGYRAAGVNRVSVGVQSLRDEELKKLGRIHTVAEAKVALEVARNTFDRFSLDLIYARPGQSPDAWRAELRQALGLAGQHMSLYQLTVEPGTRFADLYALGKLAVPEGDEALALYEVTQELTEAAGLSAYEISNHAAPGEESRHNMLYWRYGTYAGVGPGAHGRLVFEGARHAMATERNPEQWADRVERMGHGFSEVTPLSRPEEADEMLLMGMRLKEGLDLGRLAKVAGVHLRPSVLSALEREGLIERADVREIFPDEIRACVGPGIRPEAAQANVAGRIRATTRGRFVLNAVIAELAAAIEPAGAARAPPHGSTSSP
jgi:putative oxygen-independent coproporphyrinogen III oxidase